MHDKKILEIIMPPLIGDCVMVFPLINCLRENGWAITLACAPYVHDLVSFTQRDVSVKRLSGISDASIIIDFLSDESSAAHIQRSNAGSTIGFGDGAFGYDLFLRQPGEFADQQATEIFLYPLQLMGLDRPMRLDFSFGQSWCFRNQTTIMIAPGAGNLERCFGLQDFILLANELKGIGGKVAFLLGPSESHLKDCIPKGFKVMASNGIGETVLALSGTRLVVASEGGLMHLAASYGVPLLGLFRVASKRNWFPYDSPCQFALGDGGNNYDDVGLHRFDPTETLTKTKEIYGSIGH